MYKVFERIGKGCQSPCAYILLFWRTLFFYTFVDNYFMFTCIAYLDIHSFIMLRYGDRCILVFAKLRFFFLFKLDHIFILPGLHNVSIIHRDHFCCIYQVFCSKSLEKSISSRSVFMFIFTPFILHYVL